MTPSWMKPAAALLAVVILAAAPNRAAADYLMSASESQLETWLGQGDLTFTNIFSSRAGDGQTSLDFHAAVDGKGPTITLIRISDIRETDITTGEAGNVVAVVDQIIGGYDPQSWSSNARKGENITNADTDRTAFLFNLTTNLFLPQMLSSAYTNTHDWGSIQTYDYAADGPSFGGDLFVGMDMSVGFAGQTSYGTPGSTGVDGLNLVGGSGDGQYFDITGIEVYTFEAAPAVASPAPPGVLLALAGATCLVPLGWLRRRKLTS